MKLRIIKENKKKTYSIYKPFKNGDLFSKFSHSMYLFNSDVNSSLRNQTADEHLKKIKQSQNTIRGKFIHLKKEQENSPSD